MPKKLLSFILCFFITHIYSQELIISNVNIIPIEGGEMILKNQTVFIKNGIIKEITPFKQEHTSNKLKSIIDGTGKYLIPGMADMHVHLPDEKEIPLERFFKLNLAAGVTTLRSMRGEDRHLILRDSIRKKLILAPDLYISTSLPSDSTTTSSDLKKTISKARKENWDFVKYLSGLSPQLFDSAALYCKQNTIKLAGHVYQGNLQTAINISQSSVEHYQSILKAYRKDSLHFDAVLKQLKDKNIFVCPTLSFYYIWGMQFSPEELKMRNGAEYDTCGTQGYINYYNSFLQTPEKTEKRRSIITRTKKDLYDFGKILKRMGEAKVMLLLSPDESAFNVPGFSMIEEMKLYKKSGLSNYDILKIATWNAACFFGEQGKWGSISPNKKANLVLLDKNPLEDIENTKTVNTVILGGQAYRPNVLLKK